MTPNIQPIEKPFMHDKGGLDFHSIFFTLQGEGPFSGDRSIFIRLAGCNLQCPGCDTEYTEGRVLTMPSALVAQADAICHEHEMEGPLIVITGGEPMRQNLAPLICLLLERGHRVQLETNGVLPPTPELESLVITQQVTLVVSPKTWKINPTTAALASCFKYVLRCGDIDIHDGLPTKALGHKVPAARRGVARPPPEFYGTVYINPMDEQNAVHNKLNHDACAASALMHGHRMGVQLHKILNLE
ncbi:7-carboxy-7-deazaguanine synthase QueE [Candidatus Babeliales bacterium]|nr:7-carboxy-7-deazaguanine synthase QueE [Candidatus Babeliales bacterium]